VIHEPEARNAAGTPPGTNFFKKDFYLKSKAPALRAGLADNLTINTSPAPSGSRSCFQILLLQASSAVQKVTLQKYLVTRP